MAFVTRIIVYCIPPKSFASAPDTSLSFSEYLNHSEDFDLNSITTAIAAEAFPEYAEKIRSEQPLALDFTSAASGSNDVLVQETRWLSENEAVTYTEYRSGLVVTSGFFSAGKNVTSTSSGSGYSYGTLNIWMNCAGSSQTLLINDVSYAFAQGGYGSIGSLGTISRLTDAISPMYGANQKTGSAGSPAYSEYSAIFEVYTSTGGEPLVNLFYGTLRFEVGQTSYSVQAFPS